MNRPTPMTPSTGWVKNVPESNGKVGVIGSSYLGFTTLMAEIHPHPALKAVAPQSPMVDTWIGDDAFHNGAFRVTQIGLCRRAVDRQGRGRRTGLRARRRLYPSISKTARWAITPKSTGWTSIHSTS
ncbi:MAG: CocE/NonD family hydrolase [Asticcacaulis sp.]